MRAVLVLQIAECKLKIANWRTSNLQFAFFNLQLFNLHLAIPSSSFAIPSSIYNSRLSIPDSLPVFQYLSCSVVSWRSHHSAARMCARSAEIEGFDGSP